MRSIIKFVVPGFFCSLLFLVTPSLAQSVNPDVPRATSVKELKVDFPEVDGWKKGEITRYPVPGLGYSVNYDSETGMRVTVYVYDGGLEAIPNGIENNPVKAQFKQAKSDIRQFEQMKRYQNVKELEDKTITLDDNSGKVKALHALFTFSANGQDFVSGIYLFGYKNNFIKLRASRLESKNDADKDLKGLLAKFDALFSK